MSDEKFTEIARKSIQIAEQVDCSLPDFKAGLRTMIDELEDHRQLLEQELRALQASED